MNLSKCTLEIKNLKITKNKNYYLLFTHIHLMFMIRTIECMREHTSHNTQCTIGRVMHRAMVFWFALLRTRWLTIAHPVRHVEFALRQH